MRASRTPHPIWNDYPSRDGRVPPGSDWHRDQISAVLDSLGGHYRDDPNVYVSGESLVFYEPGVKQARVAPDIFVVKGVPKRSRSNFLVWQEGKGPDLVIEFTCRQTRRVDLRRKVPIYRDILKVEEYFLFDQLDEYLDPPLQGFRRVRGRYVPVRARDGRLPSRVLNLHLERSGFRLRLCDPASPASEAECGQQRRRADEAEAECARLRQQLTERGFRAN